MSATGPAGRSDRTTGANPGTVNPRTFAGLRNVLTLARLLDVPDDEPLPCRGPNRHWWCSDHKHERTNAIARCKTCPHQWPCFDNAVANHERFHVWGGVDFTTPDRRPRRTT